MAFSGGIFSKLYSWATEQATPPIEIAKLDAQESDFATGLSNCILRDGTGVPTASQDWNGQSLTNVGSLTTVGTVTVSSASPRQIFSETDVAADNKRWDFIVSGEQFVWRTVNDADSVNANICIVQRTGTTVDSVVFPTTTAGSFLVGTSTAIAPNGVMSVVAPTSVVALSLKGVTAAQTPLSLWNATIAEDSYFIEFGTEAGFSARGSITYNRGGGLTAYNTTSDARLKTNIVEAPPASDIINRVRVRSFDWRDSGAHLDHWLVAQELFEVAPHAVSEGDHGEEVERQWSIDAAKLVPLLIKGWQEQQQTIADLKARVTALENDRGI